MLLAGGRRCNGDSDGRTAHRGRRGAPRRALRSEPLPLPAQSSPAPTEIGRGVALARIWRRELGESGSSASRCGARRVLSARWSGVPGGSGVGRPELLSRVGVVVEGFAWAETPCSYGLGPAPPRVSCPEPAAAAFPLRVVSLTDYAQPGGRRRGLGLKPPRVGVPSRQPFLISSGPPGSVLGLMNDQDEVQQG